jgi:hypothetical protein
MGNKHRKKTKREKRKKEIENARKQMSTETWTTKK